MPFDNEIEAEILQDVTNLWELQIQRASNAPTVEPWLGTEAAVYISGELSKIPSPLNMVKVEIEERRHKPKPSGAIAVVNSTLAESLVFVSCGQSTPGERQLGQQIAKLVEQETGCIAYFAENQTTLEGVTENILKRLHDAVGFIAIMHPRGSVSNPSNPTRAAWMRGSVWVKQEIAIAAFISQALQRPMQVRAYVHESIRREGLRDKLHLNPVSFNEDSEILQDLSSLLPSWRGLAKQQRKDPLSLKANIQHRRVPIPGGGEDERYMLMVSLENDGEKDATDFQLDVEFPDRFLDEAGHVARKGTSKPGVALFSVSSKDRQLGHLYPGAHTPDILSFHYAIRGKIRREEPQLLQEKVTAIVSSGSMKPKVTSKTIAELAS